MKGASGHSNQSPESLTGTESVFLGISALVTGAVLFSSPDGEISDIQLVLAVVVLATCLVWLWACRRPAATFAILLASTVQVACQIVVFKDFSILIPLSLGVVSMVATAVYLFQNSGRRSALLAFGIAMVLLILAAAEVIVPRFDAPRITVSREPVGANWRDPETGIEDLMFYKETPGIWREIGSASGETVWEAVYTVGADRSRKVPDQPLSGAILGCFGGSFTFGHGLNDHETIPAVLQSLFRDVRVFNYGANGHGTSDAYLHLIHRLHEHSSIAYVVYFMIDDHIDRVGLPFSHLAVNKDYLRKPKFDLRNGELVFLGKVDRTLDPIERLEVSLLRGSWLLRRLFNGRMSQHDSSRTVTRRLITEMNQACSGSGCRFLVVRLPTFKRVHDRRIQEFYRTLEADEIPFVDLHVALEQHIAASGELWESFFIPDDGHPDATGCRFFAEKTAEAISSNNG